jgi:PAS domain S-box-containing protein
LSAIVDAAQTREARGKGFKGFLRPTAIFVLIGGIGLSGLAYWQARRLDTARIDDLLEVRAEWRTNDLEVKLEELAVPLAILSAAISALPEVTEDSFAKYGKMAVDQIELRPLALYWAPRVDGPERESFEAVVQRSGRSDYAIRELGVEGDVRLAAPRRTYLPLLFIEAFENFSRTYGFDLLSEPDRRGVVETAIANASPTMSRLNVRFVIAERNVFGFNVYLPVFPDGPAPPDPSQRMDRLRGIIGMSFEFVPSLNAAIANTPPLAEDIHVLADRPGPDGVARTLAIYRVAEGRFAPMEATIGMGSLPGKTVVKSITVLGRPVHLVFHFPPHLIAEQRTAGPVLLFVAGLLATALALVLVLVNQRYLMSVEATVRQRTAQLDESEQRLRRAHQDLSTIISTAPVAIVTFDADSRIVTWNPAAERLFGRDATSAVGRTAAEALPGRIEDNDRLLEKLRARGTVTNFATRFLPVDGRPVDLVLSGAVFRDEAGAPARSILVLNDVTEIKSIEAKFLQAQKMEAIGQLTGGLAHDFNNLLAVIIGNLDLLAERIGDDPQATEIMKDALNASLRGAELNRSLLAFSRQQPINPRSVDINALLANLTKMLQRTLGEKIRVQMNLPERLPPVLIDPPQLEASVLNLSINARDAMPSGGTLTIETANCHIDKDNAAADPELPPGDYIGVAVSDSGTGMSPEVKARVFEPFFTTKPAGQGTGLGLSMVYGFVKQSGGHVRIYSEVGHGTTVRLYLPQDKTAKEIKAVDPANAAALPRGDETVLVVEDNEQLRRVAVARLRSLGYTTIEAANAAEAMAALRSDARIDLLFTDIVLPGGVDGRALARDAGTIRPSLKTVFTSGFVPKVLGDTLAGLDILEKPYRAADLAARIRRALDGRMTAGETTS